jgi:hypothetical protein
MSGQARGQRPGPGSILLGIARLASGRVDGLRQFGATRDAFLVSLAPLIAFPLVGSVLMLLRGGGLYAVSGLLAALCALLAPPVLSFEVARLWGREAAWLRFATAFNWCQWVIPVIGCLMLLVVGILIGLGLPRAVAQVGVVLGIVAYGLWLQWFVVRHGLGLSGPRAALTVVGVNLGTVIILLGPRMIGDA